MHPTPPHETFAFHGDPGISRPWFCGPRSPIEEWARSGPRPRPTIWGTWPPNLSPSIGINHLAGRSRGHHADDLEHRVGGVDRSDSGRVEWRRHLADVAPDDVETAQGAEDHLAVADAQSAGLQRRGAGSVLGVEPVDVQRYVDRPRAQHAAHMTDHLLPAHLLVIVVGDNGEAQLPAAASVVSAELGAAKAELHDALGVEQALLGRAPEGRRVVDPRPVELVVRVRVGDYLEHAQRPPVEKAAQDRQRDDVVAANREWHDVVLVQALHELGRGLDRPHEVIWVRTDVAEVGNVDLVERRDAAE